MSWSVLEAEVRHTATDESAALRWAAGKYRTATELATLAAERELNLSRLRITVTIRPNHANLGGAA